MSTGTGGAPAVITFPWRVELPKGAHAMLRDPEDVSERLRRPYVDTRQEAMAALLSTGVKPEEFQAALNGTEQQQAEMGVKMLAAGMSRGMRDSQDLMIIALTESWSFGAPVAVESLLDLPSKTYNALRAACQKLAPALDPDFDPNPDPDSPTTPSNA
jgi:hypothetical protein